VLPSGAGEAQRHVLELVETDQAEKRTQTPTGERAEGVQPEVRSASL
jgi:hypothetical protein